MTKYITERKDPPNKEKIYMQVDSVDIPANQEGPQPTGVTVSATDADAGVNAEITYSILEEEARLYLQVR